MNDSTANGIDARKRLTDAGHAPVVVRDGRGWPLDLARSTKLDTSNPSVREWMLDMWRRRGPGSRAR